MKDCDSPGCSFKVSDGTRYCYQCRVAAYREQQARELDTEILAVNLAALGMPELERMLRLEAELDAWEAAQPGRLAA